jgi:hypothetical protein
MDWSWDRRSICGNSIYDNAVVRRETGGRHHVCRSRRFVGGCCSWRMSYTCAQGSEDRSIASFTLATKGTRRPLVVLTQRKSA